MPVAPRPSRRWTGEGEGSFILHLVRIVVSRRYVKSNPPRLVQHPRWKLVDTLLSLLRREKLLAGSLVVLVHVGGVRAHRADGEERSPEESESR